ncbi:MAG: LarC family nickel insertion protein [Thermovirgaceae bacterium]|nr:LarC family nickel insertion protein [Thermovirgaceae bacterium]
MIIFEPHLAGTGGDMLLAALLAIGGNEEILRRFPALPELGVRSVAILPREVFAGGIRSIRIDVSIDEEPVHRNLMDMTLLLESAGNSIGASGGSIERSREVLELIFAAEASVHGKTADSVHLHEIGGYDTIIDTLGFFLLLESLGDPAVISTTPSAGGGTVQTAHGLLHVPVPAVCSIAASTGMPLQGGPVHEELLTPTGAAILASSASFVETLPAFRTLKTGYGAGNKVLSIPNVIRAILAEPLEKIPQKPSETDADTHHHHHQHDDDTHDGGSGRNHHSGRKH